MPLDLAKLKQDTQEFQPKPYPEDAQPMSVEGQPRISALPEHQRPGLLVSARTMKQIEDAHLLSMSARYRTGIHMFFDKELPGNRFRFRLHKNRYGSGVHAIPVMRNLLQHLGDWRYEETKAGIGFITTDIVGLIYIKANFP